MLRRVVWQKFTYRPDDGDSKHLLNVGQFLLVYTAQHPKTAIFITKYISSLVHKNKQIVRFVTAYFIQVLI
jgi:hypothetical protein